VLEDLDTKIHLIVDPEGVWSFQEELAELAAFPGVTGDMVKHLASTLNLRMEAPVGFPTQQALRALAKTLYNAGAYTLSFSISVISYRYVLVSDERISFIVALGDKTKIVPTLEELRRQASDELKKLATKPGDGGQ
jgi:hypothetical protein